MDVETAKSVNEMADFLCKYPVPREKDVQSSLVKLETDVASIRSHLETKPKKITMAQIDKKLDSIIEIFLQNGFIIPTEMPE